MKTFNNSYYHLKEILTLEEACLYMGISKSTMYKLTSQSRAIKFFKPSGKMIYFKRADLDNYMLTNEHLSSKDLLENKIKELTK